MRLSRTDQIKHFYKHLKSGPPVFYSPPINQKLQLTPSYEIPWFEFFLEEMPVTKILEEAQGLYDSFVPHREGEFHEGWKSLCIHGLSSTQTMCYSDYGIDKKNVKYQWTEISSSCPETTKYFKDVFPADSYERIRFMLLEPGGFVFPHRDRDTKSLGPLTIALNAPKNCHFGLEKHGLVPIRAGGCYLIDLSNRHAVWNQSKEPRFHITVEANYGSKKFHFLQRIIERYEKSRPLSRWLYTDYRNARYLLRKNLERKTS